MAEYLSFLETTLSAAADAALGFFGKVVPGYKDDDADQVVTEADLAIGRSIITEITRVFPADGVINEEDGDVRGTSAITWVVDPIDGSANFAAGSPLYGVMIGVLRGGTPVAGGVALPAFGEVYLAESGSGVIRNGAALAPDHGQDLSTALVAYGVDVHGTTRTHQDFASLRAVSAHCQGLRMSNSVFDAVMVATGVYGAFLHRNCRIWDCVAPQILVEEAGGRFTDIHGTPLDYDAPATKRAHVYTVLAAAPRLHRPILEVLPP
ncbi:myo-inositol-1(or 4)-monophosphatase [Amycolatopsis marina]|uniref:Myo-inositol-1(Or 4)-monophosphatase n=1 Tax=Amycolatopsis marina TaxID=490629 RepID=A0A1I0WVW5_9PSEU|nr:inositol monophosphatase [Amycolatopsis marina]SFA92176.1 myo-inositol-1(or 4)-monophosphatase [Amycolatopsis marina]